MFQLDNIWLVWPALNRGRAICELFGVVENSSNNIWENATFQSELGSYLIIELKSNCHG